MASTPFVSSSSVLPNVLHCLLSNEEEKLVPDADLAQPPAEMVDSPLAMFTRFFGFRKRGGDQHFHQTSSVVQ